MCGYVLGWYMALPRIRPMKRYQFKLCAGREMCRNTSSVGQRKQDGIEQLMFGRIRIRIWIEFVLYVRQPESPIGVEYILSQRHKEFIGHTASIDTRSTKIKIKVRKPEIK